MRFFSLRIPHFAAWALAQTDPTLHSLPFAVCERDAVIAASPLAIQLGVRVGMANGRAASKSPDLLLLARDRNLEGLAWADIQRTLYGLTPKIEPGKAGELFAELDAKHLPQMAPLLNFWSRGGFEACGGQAADRATAQLAALSASSGQTHQIVPGRERDFIDLTRLTILKEIGIHPDSIQLLRWYGWERIGQLRRLTRRQLAEQIKGDGETLYRFAQGPKHPANLHSVATWNPPEELLAAIEFDAPALEPAHWNGALDDLLEQVCAGLGTRLACSLELCAHTPTAPVTSRRLLKEPLSQPSQMRRSADAALHEALQLLHPLPPVIQRLEVRLCNLTNAPFQRTLFEDENESRSKRLNSALELLESRMPGALGHYGASQAHSPFPEEHFRWLPALDSTATTHQALKVGGR